MDFGSPIWPAMRKAAFGRVVKLLVIAGAEGWNELLPEAVSSGDLDFVKFLIERDAYDDIHDDHALPRACGIGTEMVKVLLDAGADMNHGNGAALWYALSHGSNGGTVIRSRGTLKQKRNAILWGIVCTPG